MSALTACLNCGTELPTRTGTSGRPPDYCGTACRQAAYRKRRKPQSGAGRAPSDTDTAVQDIARDVLEEARHLVRVLARPDAPLLDPVEQAVSLSRSVELLTAVLVSRARRSKVPWATLGPALAMQPDTARRTYRADTVNRRITAAARPAPPLRQPPPAPSSPSSPSAGAAQANRPRSHLAPVLSRLQRASRIPLRALSERLGISPSQTSRILSGERFPDWRLTERFAQVCGADPLVLRKVWEDEKLREEQPAGAPADPVDGDPSERLRVALRTLHIKAGRPAAEVLAEATRHRSRTEDIDAALAGNAPHWPQLVDLVQALGGDPAYFQQLWEASSCRSAAGNPWPGGTTAATQWPATSRPATPRPTTPRPAPPRQATPRPAAALPHPSDERLVHLFQMFGPVLATSPRTR